MTNPDPQTGQTEAPPVEATAVPESAGPGQADDPRLEHLQDTIEEAKHAAQKALDPDNR